ncbi:MAG: DUF3179 domain-containing protein [Gemmatimonadetes bacterium]|nr:DUF3179 domain-containing protein [Gemmatimonadota bacterium]
MRRLPSLLAVAVLPVSGCSLEDGIGTGPIPDEPLVCDLDPAYLADGGVGRDGIPALSDPLLVPISPVVPANAYVRDEDRVIAVRVGAEWIVIPHNIMWQHEIVNFSGGLDRMSVTYCPLTGTALAFDRTAAGGAELAVSGLLYQANLIMYDRNEPEESFWPQMLGEARCGPRSGARLSRLPVVEMTMGGWKELHPDSRMVGLSGGLNDWRLYVRNPYGEGYDDPHNADFQDYPIPLDDGRLPPKERVLGLPADGPGAAPVALSFAAMGRSGDHAVFEFDYGGAPAIVIWDGLRRAAMAYRPEVGGSPTTFRATPQGVVDELTETTWAVDGIPVAGPLAATGRRLPPVADAYVAFWGAWAAFHPGTALLLTPG